MKILYLTNIHNPYRDEFFEQLGREVDLTVLFEQRSDSDRDSSWFETVRPESYKEVFFLRGGGKILPRSVLNLMNKQWDHIVIGCINSFLQIAIMRYMRSRHMSYIINLDDPCFPEKRIIKRWLKRHILCGAKGYLVAGLKSEKSVRAYIDFSSPVFTYPFSSLTQREIRELKVRSACGSCDRNLILCVGRYLPYKGLDILLEVAKGMPKANFRIVGVGKRKDLLDSEIRKAGLANVSSTAFICPRELFEEYLKAGLVVLPSRQECWGLVINEAAACGTPVASTWGAGAAVDFLSESYPELLSIPGDSFSLAQSIRRAFEMSVEDRLSYSEFLQTISSSYTVEACVKVHVEAFKSLLSD